MFDRIYDQLSAAAAIGYRFTSRGQIAWEYLLRRRARQ